MRKIFRSIPLVILMVCIVGGIAYAKLSKQDYITDWVMDSSRESGMVLDKITIIGAEKTPEILIEQVLDVENGMALLAVDLADVRKNVEKLPWIKSVSLKRRYPDELQVFVKERTPYALWQTGGAVGLIDKTGRILTRENLQAYKDHLLLVGDTAVSNIEEIDALLSSQPEISRFVRSAVHVSDRRWDIHFQNGMRLRLPEKGIDDQATKAFDRFAALEREHNLLAREVAVIDLRGEKVIIQLTPQGKKALNIKDLFQ